MSDFQNGVDRDGEQIATLHLNITGRVQGVGYRDSMRLIAQALNVTGWVRNRTDGSVEALVQGAEQDVERVIAWCHNGPPGANVKYVNVTLTRETQTFIAFSRVPTA
jgi:acylphosphatase